MLVIFLKNNVDYVLVFRIFSKIWFFFKFVFVFVFYSFVFYINYDNKLDVFFRGICILKDDYWFKIIFNWWDFSNVNDKVSNFR